MNGKAMVAVWVIIAILLVGVGAIVYYVSTSPPSETTVSTQAEELQEVATTGDIASLRVWVRDLANNNINTHVAVPTYCVDGEGKAIIDATSSSTTATIQGITTRGQTAECWAFNATYQSLAPTTINVNAEAVPVTIDAFHVPNNARVQIYDDELNTGNLEVNVTGVAASTTVTMQKIKITNNNTDFILPIGGLYIDVITSTNISTIETSGNANFNLRSSSFMPSVSSVTWSDLTGDLGTQVSARREIWDFVFGVSAGDNVLYLEEGDWVETGPVRVTADGDGCEAAEAIDLVSMFAYTSGYYRATRDSDFVLFGHETDAASSSVITADITGDTFYCVG